MRVGVLDVGSNTVRLVVADADGAAPMPLHTAKRRLRLAERVAPDGRLDDACVRDLVETVAAARDEARRWEVAEPFAFATAVVRDAPNRAEIQRQVRDATGVELRVMPGRTEAELAFLAARQWMGWRAGPLALLDIGGGSLEVAFGRSGLPDLAVSLPLGAGRLTRERLGGAKDPVPRAEVKALRRHVRRRLRDIAARLRWEAPRTAVATSRSFQQLARLCGAPPGREGPFADRVLTRKALGKAVRRLAELPAEDRAELPGISAGRAEQCLAAAVVGHTAMDLMGIDTVTVCPWAVREGLLLRALEEGRGQA
jgi:exopolyphosphatase/guanosine-5'-triphosphate,3'-diphosphate pyrophosphatase